MRTLALAVGLLALAAACSGGDGAPQRPSPSPLFGELVSYETEDGVRVVAELATPEGASAAPPVILLHQLNGSRAQWAPLVQPLLDAGYAVLAPDMRGFGDSTDCGAAGRCLFGGPESVVQDVAAALRFLEGRSGVDAGHAAVVGASIGGTAAWFASGSFPEVQAAVALSPVLREPQGPLPGAETPFQPAAVLFLADEREAPDAQALADLTGEPVEIEVVEGVQAHGVQLLDQPGVIDRIIAWLEEHVPPGR